MECTLLHTPCLARSLISTLVIHYYISTHTPKLLFLAILTDLDDLVALRGILPTAREQELFSTYTGKVKQLAPAETWLRMCVVRFSGSELANMVDALAFKLAVDEGMLVDVLTGTRAFVRVCQAICESVMFKGLLRCLYRVAQCTDEDFAKWGPRSFRAWMGKDARALFGLGVDGLVGVCKISSADGAWRLVDFLVGVCWGTQKEASDASDAIINMYPHSTHTHTDPRRDRRFPRAKDHRAV